MKSLFEKELLLAVGILCWAAAVGAQNNLATSADLPAMQNFKGSGTTKVNAASLKIGIEDAKKFANLQSNTSSATSIEIKDESKNRGAKEVQVYEQISSGTVLIVTDEGIGSGALITDKGHIITNQHVVGGAKYVSVFFKPIGSKQLSKNDAILGEVVKTNSLKDLALVKINKLPTYARPIALSNAQTVVGEDAHAIGHPKGEFWSYTKGYVSAVRDNYQWSDEDESLKHKAKIVQTQTPINPGNSGGPLVNDERKLIGINSFIQANSPGLNYAVSVEDVKAFLGQEGSTQQESSSKKKANCGDDPVTSGTKKDDKDGPVDFISYDTNCSGNVNMVLIMPKNKTKPTRLILDSNGDGKTDIVVFDIDRDGKWDVSFHDTDYDGKYDLIGRHPDGKLTPTSYEPYNK